MAWIYLAISSCSPPHLTCQWAAFRRPAILDEKQVKLALSRWYKTSIWRIYWSIKDVLVSKVLFKWEPTVESAALWFATKSLCSEDFPWQLGLPTEWKKCISNKIQRKKQSGGNSFRDTQAVQGIGLSTELLWDISQQTVLLRQDVGGCSYEEQPTWLHFCYLWGGYAKSIKSPKVQRSS